MKTKAARLCIGFLAVLLLWQGDLFGQAITGTLLGSVQISPVLWFRMRR